MNLINSKNDSISKIEDALNKPKMSIVLIHHIHCGICVDLKPTWEKFKTMNKNKPFNIIDIEANELPSLNHSIKNNIIGFPTIMKVHNGKIDENFMKERTLDNFISFANSNLVKKKLNNLNKVNNKVNKVNNKVNKTKNQKRKKLKKVKKNKTKKVKN